MGEQPGAADIGDEPDRGLGHRELRAFGDDARAALHVRGKPDAAAHYDAVHNRHERFRVTADKRVEGVFLAPEGERVAEPARAAFVEPAHVAAGTQPTLAGAVENDQFDRRIVAPREQRRPDRPDHPERQRVERFRAVQRDAPGAAFDADQDFVARLAHAPSAQIFGVGKAPRAFSNARPMRSASASSKRRTTICRLIGSLPLLSAVGTASPHSAR